jgi:outer membrane biosynthesis protein TonB
MLRPIALALLCLFLVGALLAVRTTIATRAIAEPAASEAAPDAVPEADDDSPPLAKSDRLPMVDPDAKRVPVIPIEVAPAEKNAAETRKETKLETPTVETKPTETPKAETRPKETPKAEARPREAPKPDETISWHWHVGSKISKRTGKPVQ